MTYELVVGPVEKIVEKILHALDLDVEWSQWYLSTALSSRPADLVWTS
jgi:hypothetical protein